MTFHARTDLPYGYVVCDTCDEIVPVSEMREHVCPDDDTLSEINESAEKL